MEPSKENCVTVNKSERSWTLDMETLSLEFVQLDFGLALVQYFLMVMFWNDNVCPVMLEAWVCFLTVK